MAITSVLNSSCNLYKNTINLLDALSDSIPPIFLRLILAWEFGEAGFAKLNGTNWFNELTFPFPFNLVSAEVSWNMALYFEILGAFALVLGFATRFFAFSLLVLAMVAIATVHWPEHWSTFYELFTGYRVVDDEGDGFGNYKLPLLFIVMLLPLIFSGAGRFSLDYLIKKRWR